MSYCVNCGVELGESERRCPLCRTDVSNPRKPFDPKAKSAYPRGMSVRTETENRVLTYILASCLFVLPIAICLVCNWVIDRSITWSLYVLGSILLVWLFVFPPQLIKKGTALISLTIDTVGVLALLYLTEYLTLAEDPALSPWFWDLAAPIAICVAALAGILILSVQQYRTSFWNIVALLLALISMLCVVLEALTSMHISSQITLQWSFLVIVPCTILSLVCLIVARKRRLKNSIKKRFHV